MLIRLRVELKHSALLFFFFPLSESICFTCGSFYISQLKLAYHIFDRSLRLTTAKHVAYSWLVLAPVVLFEFFLSRRPKEWAKSFVVAAQIIHFSINLKNIAFFPLCIIERSCNRISRASLQQDSLWWVSVKISSTKYSLNYIYLNNLNHIIFNKLQSTAMLVALWGCTQRLSCFEPQANVSMLTLSTCC